MERNYIAFISYRHLPRDMAIAKRLHSLIEKYTIPEALRKNGRKKLGIVFRDQEELAASSDLSADIQIALSRSKYLIVICSPGSAESIWVNREIQFFLETHDRKHVLVVLSDGEPNNAFPKILTHVYDEATGSTSETEPLAVDVRSQNTYGSLRKVRKEYTRLIAAILGCSYDDLVLREQKRTLQRILSASVVSCVVVSCFLGMLWNKNHQIAEKNEALAVEKANVQYRESQLLTADAETAMAEGDYRTAIRLAVEALPGGSNPDRPYYAPAESVLLEAMNVFDEITSGNSMYDTTLKQMTPVADYCISDDGRKVITIDDYGQLHCFDSSDGAILWSSYTQASDYVLAGDTKHIMTCRGNERIATFFHDSLTCFDQTSGRQLWDRDIGGCVKNCLFYNAEQDVFLCFMAEYDIALDCTRIEFHVISGKTGQLIWRIPFMQNENLTQYVYSQKWGGYFATGGAFSEDGTVFVGAFAEWSEASQSTILKCYRVDIQNGTAEFLRQVPLSDVEDGWIVTDVSLTEQENAAAITVSGSNSTIVTRLDRNVDGATWQCELCPETGSASFSYEKAFTKPWGSGVFTARSDQLYYLDIETGAILDFIQLPGAVTWLDQTSDITIGFFMDSGEYGIAWKNPAGIHTAVLGVGLYEAAKNYSGGIYQFYADEQNGEYEISVSNRVREGYAAVVPREDNTTIHVKRPSEIIRVIQENAVELPWDNIDSSDVSVCFSAPDRIIVGPFIDKNSQYYAAIDLRTNAVTKAYAVNQAHYETTPFFVPEEDMYILHTLNGTVVSCTNGIETILTTGANADNGYSQTCSASSYLAATNEVVTASLEANMLRIWINGIEIDPVPLPQEQTLSDAGSDIVNSFVAVYPSGDILVSKDKAVVYHLSTGNWTVIRSPFSIPNENAFAVSDSGTYLAFADHQDMLQILDGQSGGSVISFDLQMPYESVDDMCFSLDNSVLIVKTVDNRIRIFDVAIGEMVFSGALGDRYYTKLQVYEDSHNQRLYLSGQNLGGSSNGICIDIQMWTELSEVRNMIFFDSERGLLYRYGSDGGITYSKIPDIAGEIELAIRYLQS